MSRIKNVILVDDMADTAGTITKAADLMMSHGAKTVRALCSHAIMSDPATERVTNSSLCEMIFTNSIPYSKHCPKVTYLSVARLLPTRYAVSMKTSRSRRSIL